MTWTADNKKIETVIREADALRGRLHLCPEASGCEVKTKLLLMEYLKPEKESSGTSLVDMGKWFYLVHREEGAEETLAFRADMDAVAGPDGRPYHGCGHDGHSAVMAALAKSLEKEVTGRNLVFLFQHAEETGEGAAQCLLLFDREKIDGMTAFHNIPGYPAGCVMFKEDTFACASRGLRIRFEGKQSHAAYPELGKNPVYPIGELISRLPDLAEPSRFKGMTLCTPVYLQAGTPAYGVAAGEGELCLTLRAWYDEDLNRLEEEILRAAEELSGDCGIAVSHENRDVFAASMNDSKLLLELRRAALAAGLPLYELKEPMRWSEDFGQFGKRTRTCMVGIGGGEEAAGLHTPGYRWNEKVTEAAIRLFGCLIAAS